MVMHKEDYKSQGGRFISIHPKMKERRPTAAKDLTLIAIVRQLKGLGCTHYEIGIFYRLQGRMLIRTWCTGQIIKYLSKLKQENARGAEIFCRPAGPENQGIVLIDDLNLFQIQQLETQELKAAVVVETSPQNFQAWIRVSKTSLSKEIATRVAKYLANTFQADPNSADWRHFGRLAGFTNRKPQHATTNGLYPWVLLHSYWGALAPKGEELVKEAKKLITHPKIVSFQCNNSSPSRAVETFKKLFQQFEARYGNQGDFSRIDWAVVKIMLQRGYSPQDVADGLLHASSNIKERKIGHLKEYINRTITKAMSEVIVNKSLE